VIKVDRLRFSRVSHQDRTFSLARAFVFNRDHDTPQQARGGHIVFHERQQRANILAGMPHKRFPCMRCSENVLRIIFISELLDLILSRKSKNT